jgi:hypothetical protein
MAYASRSTYESCRLHTWKNQPLFSPSQSNLIKKSEYSSIGINSCTYCRPNKAIHQVLTQLYISVRCMLALATHAPTKSYTCEVRWRRCWAHRRKSSLLDAYNFSSPGSERAGVCVFLEWARARLLFVECAGGCFSHDCNACMMNWALWRKQGRLNFSSLLQ